MLAALELLAFLDGPVQSEVREGEAQALLLGLRDLEDVIVERVPIDPVVVPGPDIAQVGRGKDRVADLDAPVGSLVPAHRRWANADAVTSRLPTPEPILRTPGPRGHSSHVEANHESGNQ